MRSTSDRRRRYLRLALIALGLSVIALAAFAWTGLNPRWRTPTIHERLEAQAGDWDGELSLIGLNLAKLGFHRGGLDFAPRALLEQRVELVAEQLITEDADVVCLSEVVSSGGPVRLHQLRALAAAGNYPYWVYLPNYDFGLPGLHVCAGNGILSRFPLRNAKGRQLAGQRPFWSPTNNRRALWCEVQLGDRWVPLASIRNDSFDLGNNGVQAAECLDELNGQAALIAGDFNCTPQSEPGQLWRSAPQLAALATGPATHPADQPTRRIDDALWPRDWELLEEGLVDTSCSDHLGVLFRWRVSN